VSRSHSDTTILIAGAGPVGLSIAALLLSGPMSGRLKLRIVDPGSPPASAPDSMDLRVYALSRASQRLLERVNAWKWLADRRISPYRKMHVWEGDRNARCGHIDFNCADIGEPDLGHIVEDCLLREALFAAAIDGHANVDCYFGTKVASLDRRASVVRAELDNGERLDCAAVIAADGTQSPIRRLLGIDVVGRSYEQQALVTHVESELSHMETAWQRFLPGGPLAFLPLSDGRSSIVWSLPESRAGELYSASDEAFARALQEASGDVLGRLACTGPRALFPLYAQHALTYSRPGVVLAGDAAHAVHPLAGQGMNLGLLDAHSLAAVIEQALSSGEHVGDLRVLRRYERQRKGANLSMMLALDGFDRIFRMPQWMAPLRAAGLAAVDYAPGAKRALMMTALGLRERDSMHAGQTPG